ncbi:MAG: hypothetical protein J7L66_03310 [Anaerolineaceae bacterium]|nr:hypothetical protein [Anaerolineaceae bacterium]
MREYALQHNRFRVWQLSRSLPADLNLSNQPPVVFFNASTRLSGVSQNAGFSLITSLALQKRNIPVYHFICRRGLHPCLLGTDRENLQKNPPCRECIRTSKYIFNKSASYYFTFTEDNEIKKRIKELDLDRLLNFEYMNIPLGKMILPSMRWILRRHHLADIENNRILARSYIQSAWNVYRKFSELLESIHPRAVVVFNGMFYPEAVAKFAAREKGIMVYSHEVGMLPFSAFFTDKEATAYPVNVDRSLRLNAQQEKRLDMYLKNRFNGKFQTAGVQFWSKMQLLDEKLEEKINAFSAFVPVFTNVIFDTSQSHANSIFSHMFSWLETVVEKIKQHPEIMFIIRAHPDEVRPGKKSRESVAEWFRVHKLDHISNLLLIRPDEFVSSYELIKRAKFVMVYNSTVGLEASIMGKPVLCAGKARYTQVPTVFFPETREAYIKLLDKFLDAERVEQPQEHIDNARCVLYSQLFRASLPFDEFLEEDRVWQGYCRIKKFSAEMLKPGNSTSLDVVVNGILKNESFIRKI